MLGEVQTVDFEYDLPAELIAQQPAEPRDSARLMVLDRARGTIEHRAFRDLPDLLQPGDLLVVNDTRVMAARLKGVRPDTGGTVEALLVSQREDRLWAAMFRPARRATVGRQFEFQTGDGTVGAVCRGRDQELVLLEFDEVIDPSRAGSVPLPPYITAYKGDAERYQTVYAREARSAAAPTAGLHFTRKLFLALKQRGIERADISLDVGPGTFRPVAEKDPSLHVMHSERYSVSEDAASAIGRADRDGRVVAIGTTVVRNLETVAKLRGKVEAWEGETDLFLLPGAEFSVVNALITNFHLPRSTLLMLVAAFAGREFVLRSYQEAVRERYRFYSFGDAMLIL